MRDHAGLRALAAVRAALLIHLEPVLDELSPASAQFLTQMPHLVHSCALRKALTPDSNALDAFSGVGAFATTWPPAKTLIVDFPALVSATPYSSETFVLPTVLRASPTEPKPRRAGAEITPSTEYPPVTQGLIPFTSLSLRLSAL